MNNPLQPFLECKEFVILDGALATEVERRGADLRDPLWSAKLLLENPDLIRQVHLDYLEAGADVITTASYQTSFEGFARRSLDREQAADLMRLSIRLAQEAREKFLANRTNCSPRPLVAASVGCYGATLHDGSEYRGDYGLSMAQLRDWHRPRLQVLAESGADLIACETIPCRAEAEALERLLEEFPETPAWMSFSCRDERHVCHGETLAACVAVAAKSPNIVAVGINCTPPRFVEGLLRSLANVTSKPLLAYPNSGESWDAERRCWIDGADPLDWGAAAKRWHNAGARLIGGCCRTTPDTIRAIAKACRSGFHS
ncbi:MAG: homocysteine S-methyltransferase [Planctomycetes bacterium]|nr:homocysteine S-methyltransferase [Planctomycetota bacterium]